MPSVAKILSESEKTACRVRTSKASQNRQAVSAPDPIGVARSSNRKWSSPLASHLRTASSPPPPTPSGSHNHTQNRHLSILSSSPPSVSRSRLKWSRCRRYQHRRVRPNGCTISSRCRSRVFDHPMMKNASSNTLTIPTTHHSHSSNPKSAHSH